MIYIFKKIKNIYRAFPLSLILYFLSAKISFAATAESCGSFYEQFKYQIAGKEGNTAQGLPGFCTIGDLIQTGITTITLFAGSIAVLFIIIGGFWYLSSAGNDEQAEKGKKTLFNSIIGLVVIIMAYAIVRVVVGLLNGK